MIACRFGRSFRLPDRDGWLAMLSCSICENGSRSRLFDRLGNLIRISQGQGYRHDELDNRLTFRRYSACRFELKHG